MSVTMSLYKVREDVEYVGSYIDHVDADAFKTGEDGLCGIEKIEKELGAPMASDGHWPQSHNNFELYEKYMEWCNEQRRQEWSDGNKHDKIDVTHLKTCFRRCRGWKRIRNKLKDFNHKTFESKRCRYKYIAVDEVEYAQGWFFKNSFFKKEITFVICTTKQQMENFFNRYIDFNCKRDTRGREAVERFMTSWEDGMIFKCAW